MTLADCNPGDLVVIRWHDPPMHETARHGTLQVVLFGSGGKKNRIPIVEICDPETLEPKRDHHNMHFQPREVEVISVIKRNKRGQLDRDAERSQDKRGDRDDPMFRNHERAASFALEADLDTAGFTKGEKVEHVKAAGQTRAHHCHWPRCDKQVPPAMWGCKMHWMMIPKKLRDRIWATYKPGQEATMSPSEAYLEAADDVQQWIKGFIRRTKENRQ